MELKNVKMCRGLLCGAMFFIFGMPVYSKPDFNIVGRYVIGVLENKHYSPAEVGDELSNTIFKDYFDTLDPKKHFFTKKDYEFFEKKYADKFDDYLIQKRLDCMEPINEIYELYIERVQSRVDYACGLLKDFEFDYTKDESIEISREDSNWPESEEEALDLWRREVKSMLLDEELRLHSLKKRAEEKGKELDAEDLTAPKKKVKKRYVRLINRLKKSDEEAKATEFFDVVSQTYASHTSYMSRGEIESFTANAGLSFAGIGASLNSQDDGKTKIIGIVNGGPADRQGELVLEDRIVGVDSKNNGKMVDVLYLPLSEVVELIRGEINTEVRLKVERYKNGVVAETKEIVIKRDRIKLKDAEASAVVIHEQKLDGNVRKMGYMVLPQFYGGNAKGSSKCSEDIARLLKRLNKEGVEGLIMDLRGNPGGYLDEVVRMTGLFVGRGPVVQVRHKYNTVVKKKSRTKKPIFTKPLVVLVDKSSASASEIFAAAMQDYNRGIVIGDSSTYGKGTVQEIEMLERYFPVFEDSSRAGAIKSTVQKYYRISGESTQLKGVVSDIQIPSILEVYEIGEAWGKHPLPNDKIESAEYKKFASNSLFIDKLKEESAVRIKNSQDFKYVLEDIKLTKERIEKNLISLNKEKRLEERETAEKQRKARNAERRERFAKIEEQEKEHTLRYRLTLDDLKKEELELADYKRDSESFLRMAKKKHEDLNDAPEWPSNVDPYEREAIRILDSLIEYNKLSLRAEAKVASSSGIN